MLWLSGIFYAEEAGGDGSNLAKPEFEGMWDQHKPYKVPKDLASGPKLPGSTKMERVSSNSTITCLFVLQY